MNRLYRRWLLPSCCYCSNIWGLSLRLFLCLDRPGYRLIENLFDNFRASITKSFQISYSMFLKEVSK